MLLPLQRRMLSASLASLHKKKYTGELTNPKFYENDFMATKIKEIEYIRSPFYDLSKSMSPFSLYRFCRRLFSYLRTSISII